MFAVETRENASEKTEDVLEGVKLYLLIFYTHISYLRV